jgi:hypothetical protein
MNSRLFACADPLPPNMVRAVARDYVPDALYEVLNHLLVIHYNDISKSAQFAEELPLELLAERLHYPSLETKYLSSMHGWMKLALAGYIGCGWKVKRDAGLYVFSKKEENKE